MWCRGPLVAAVLLSLPIPALAGPVLDRILQEQVFRLGVRTDAPPFASLNNGQFSGFSLDLCALVAKGVVDSLKQPSMRGDLVAVNATDRFDKLEAGEIDVLCGATTATLSRRERVAFSIPTFITGIGGAVRPDAPALLKDVIINPTTAGGVQSVVSEALKGRAVGVLKGTTAEAWLQTSGIAGLQSVEIIPVKSHSSALDQLAASDFDVYIADHSILLGLNRQRQSRVLISKKTFTDEPYALALPKGDEEFRLVIDRVLSRLYRSGQIFDVFKEHFGKPTRDVLQFYRFVSLPK